MHRWRSGLRSMMAFQCIPQFPRRYHFSSDRLLPNFSNLHCRPPSIPHPLISSYYNPLSGSVSCPNLSRYSNHSNPVSLMQVRYITAKQREKKLKSRKPTTPVTSKVKKVKIKFYSSFKGRFRVMNDGQIRRWKEGKRHNAHSKSKKSKRQLRQPGIVPSAYAKVMKKLNFCG